MPISGERIHTLEVLAVLMQDHRSLLHSHERSSGKRRPTCTSERRQQQTDEHHHHADDHGSEEEFDARGAAQYAAGHVPGAVSAPTRDNLDESGLLLAEEVLRKRFADLGIDGSQPVGLYCGGGVAAAHQVAVLHTLGIEAALFVGSFSAWSADPARPIARGQ